MTLHDLAVMTFAALCLAAVIMIAAVIRQLRAAADEADDECSDYRRED